MPQAVKELKRVETKIQHRIIKQSKRFYQRP